METSYELTVGQALQLFYKYGLSALPVVNERSELIGTFEKSDAVGLGTLRARLEEPLSPHLARLMSPAGPAIEARLKRLLFEKSRTIPVLTREGKISHFWHVGEEPVEGDVPMPYHQLMLSLVERLQRPAAVIFQEPRAGEAASPSFLRRVGIVREGLRAYLDQLKWQGSEQDTGMSVMTDAEGLTVFLVRTPLRLRDQHFGWILETRESYEMAADCLCATGGDGDGKGSQDQLRKKMGAQELRRVVNAFEQYLIRRGLGRTAGDLRRLTGLLGVSRQSLRYKLRKHRVTPKNT